MIAILTAIESETDDSTRKAMPRPSRDLLTNLRSLANPESNYRNYNAARRDHETSGCILWHGNTLTHIMLQCANKLASR
jgi:hypothetical protein